MKWSKEIITEEIRGLHRKGEYLDSQEARLNHKKLYGAAYRHFGGWDKAVEAAGINPYKVKRHRKRTIKKPPASTTTKIQRMIRLIYYIHICPGIKARELAEKLGVSRKTIVRYIKDLRDIPEIEIVYIDDFAGYEINFRKEGGNQ